MMFPWNWNSPSRKDLGGKEKITYLGNGISILEAPPQLCRGSSQLPGATLRLAELQTSLPDCWTIWELSRGLSATFQWVVIQLGVGFSVLLSGAEAGVPIFLLPVVRCVVRTEPQWVRVGIPSLCWFEINLSWKAFPEEQEREGGLLSSWREVNFTKRRLWQTWLI